MNGHETAAAERAIDNEAAADLIDAVRSRDVLADIAGTTGEVR